MPVSPADAEDLARQVRGLYEEAEDALLGRLRDALAAGIQAPGWAEDKLRSIGQLRAGVEEIIAALRQDATGAIGRAVAQAYERGQQAAVAELGMLPEGLRAAAARDIPNAPSVDRLARAAVDEQQPVWQRILRAVLDIYRTVVTRASATVLTGVNTRRQATQRALDAFAGRGITGFTDRAGRNWEMASYAEMAVRTTTARAAVQGHTDRLQAMGQRLVIVSDSPLECERCEPWEGKVLALDGEPGPHTVRVEHATEDGRLVAVHVAGTLPEARARGLFHPNCRHSVSLYLPGVTQRPKSPLHPGGATYEDTQRQRYYERQVRAWKRRAAAAMTDPDRRRANANARAYQARIRELTADKGLHRKREREQLQTGRAPAPTNQAADDALRIRVDKAAPARMTDEQLAAAAGTGRLSPTELARVQAEADRRDLEDILARVRPGGRLAADLTGVSDDDLARALPHLAPEDALRVAAEFDRRHPVAMPPAAGSVTVAGQLADRAAVDELLAPPAPTGDPHASLSTEERWIAEREAAEAANRGAFTREQIRELYAEHVYAQWLDAEDWCRGVLLTKRAERDGVDPRTLFSGPSHVAYARASEELKRYWAEVAPRLTLAEYREQVTGIRSAAAETARQAKKDRNNEL